MWLFILVLSSIETYCLPSKHSNMLLYVLYANCIIAFLVVKYEHVAIFFIVLSQNIFPFLHINMLLHLIRPTTVLPFRANIWACGYFFYCHPSKHIAFHPDMTILMYAIRTAFCVAYTCCHLFCHTNILSPSVQRYDYILCHILLSAHNIAFRSNT